MNTNKIIRAYDVIDRLKPGMHVQVLTNADHESLGTRSQTNSWYSSNAEERFCGFPLTLNESIIDDIKNNRRVVMRKFPEPQVDGSPWEMHYLDFKVLLKETIKEVTFYQSLRVNTETFEITPVIFSKDIEIVKTINERNKQNCKDEKILYKIIEIALPIKTLEEL